MAAIAEVGAKDSKKPENEKGKVTIYFGVFFDGTNNHRLQVLLGKKYREKKGLKNTLDRDEQQIAKQFRLDVDEYNEENKLVDEGERYNLQREKDSLDKVLQENDGADVFINTHRRDRLDSVTKDLEFDLSKYKYDETTYKEHAIQTNDFTNIAILESFYRAKEKITDNEYAYKIYVSGSGVERELEKIGNWKGAAFGQGTTGVVGKVKDAISCINVKLTHFANVEDKNVTLNFHLFGFSRGATEARVFAHVVNQQKNMLSSKELTDSELQELTSEQRSDYLKQKNELQNKHDCQEFKLEDRLKMSNEMSKDRETRVAGGAFALYSVIADVIAEKKYQKEVRQLNRAVRRNIQYNKKNQEEKDYLETERKDDQDLENCLCEHVFKGQERIKSIIKNGCVSIPAMGIYDTVSSVGVLFNNTIKNNYLIDIQNCTNAFSKLHHRNVKDLGLNDLKLVDDIYHICALDEYRENFALVPVPKEAANKSVTQIYIPGCHADVGGGYSEGYDKKISFKEESLWIPFEAIPYHLREPQEGFVFDEKYAFSYSLHNLKETMWFNENKDKPDINGSDRIDRMRKLVSIYRYSKKGYNYVSLHLMVKKFNPLFSMNDNNFCVPDDLSDIYIGALSTGNGCYYPEPGRYRELRKDYLHISMDGGIVNSPNVISIKGNDNETKKILSRIEYTDDYCDKVVEKNYGKYIEKKLEMMNDFASKY